MSWQGFRWPMVLPRAEDAEDARELANDILSEPRFAQPLPSSTSKPPEFEFTDSPSVDMSWLSALAWVILVAIVVAAIVFLVLALLKMERKKKATKPKQTADSPKPALAIVPDQHLGEWEDERDISTLLTAAQAALARGDIRLAIRLRFRAGLLQLAEHSLLTFKPSLSTRQVAGALRTNTFTDIGVTFDSAAYGQSNPTPEEYRRSNVAWERLLVEEVSP